MNSTEILNHVIARQIQGAILVMGDVEFFYHPIKHTDLLAIKDDQGNACGVVRQTNLCITEDNNVYCASLLPFNDAFLNDDKAWNVFHALSPAGQELAWQWATDYSDNCYPTVKDFINHAGEGHFNR